MSDKLIDLHVEEVEHKPYDGNNFEKLTLEFSGKDAGIKFVNSIRRACTDDVPKYGFARELIKITKNTTVAYNNDYMSLRLSMLPIFNVKEHNIDPGIDYLHERYWQDVNFLEDRPMLENSKGEQVEKNIEVQINVHNNTDTNMNVDTNNPGFKVYIDNEKVDMYNKEYPILLIILRPDESFSCSMKAVLATGQRDPIWSACTNAWHYYVDDDPEKNVRLSMTPAGMLMGYDILDRACGFLIKKAEITKKEVMRVFDKYPLTGDVFEIELRNEDDTLGQLIACEIQDQEDNIIYAGINKPDRLIRNINITVQRKHGLSNDKLRETLNKAFERLHKKLMYVKMKIDDLNGNSVLKKDKSSSKSKTKKVKKKK